jgi:outer membrane murein-binding lipoprotein Lpp
MAMTTSIRSAISAMTIAGVLVLAGCNQASKDTNSTNNQVQLLEAKTAALQSQIDALQRTFEDEKQRQAVAHLFDNADKVAYLTPGSDGYSVLHYDLGTLTVQLADVEPYANGSKVILRFGNTMAAAVNGLKLTVDWGIVTDQSPDNAHQHSKEMTFSEQLRSGAWTSVPVVLDSVPPAQLGFVRVHDVTHTGIVLLTR